MTYACWKVIYKVIPAEKARQWVWTNVVRHVAPKTYDKYTRWVTIVDRLNQLNDEAVKAAEKQL